MSSKIDLNEIINHPNNLKQDRTLNQNNVSEKEALSVMGPAIQEAVFGGNVLDGIKEKFNVEEKKNKDNTSYFSLNVLGSETNMVDRKNLENAKEVALNNKSHVSASYYLNEPRSKGKGNSITWTNVQTDEEGDKTITKISVDDRKNIGASIEIVSNRMAEENTKIEAAFQCNKEGKCKAFAGVNFSF